MRGGGKVTDTNYVKSESQVSSGGSKGYIQEGGKNTNYGKSESQVSSGGSKGYT